MGGAVEPAQVVWRRAPLPVTEVELDPDEAAGAEAAGERFDPRRYRIDLRTSAAAAVRTRARAEERALAGAASCMHHLIGDHSTLEILHEEVDAILDGRGDELAAPQPFRNLVAQARLGVSARGARAVLPRSCWATSTSRRAVRAARRARRRGGVAEARRMLSSRAERAAAAQARRLGVSVASLCHVALAQVRGADERARAGGVRDGAVRAHAGRRGRRAGDGAVHQHAAGAAGSRRDGVQRRPSGARMQCWTTGPAPRLVYEQSQFASRVEYLRFCQRYAMYDRRCD